MARADPSHGSGWRAVARAATAVAAGGGYGGDAWRRLVVAITAQRLVVVSVSVGPKFVNLSLGMGLWGKEMLIWLNIVS